MTEPATVQLPRVNVSTIAAIVGITVPVLMLIGALLVTGYNYVFSRAQYELSQTALEKRLSSFEMRYDEGTKIQTEATRAVEKRLDHMDDTIAHLQVQATPKHGQ
jgi:hypothetical protein